MEKDFPSVQEAPNPLVWGSKGHVHTVLSPRKYIPGPLFVGGKEHLLLHEIGLHKQGRCGLTITLAAPQLGSAVTAQMQQQHLNVGHEAPGITATSLRPLLDLSNVHLRGEGMGGKNATVL